LPHEVFKNKFIDTLSITPPLRFFYSSSYRPKPSRFMSPLEAGHWPRRKVVLVFLSFALAYFLSTWVRAVTATLSPTLTLEFGLSAKDLGLLAGAYFFGFALTQLPMGRWLDRFGPQKVILAFLTLAVLGCLSFAVSDSFTALLISRLLIGMGVSACLMAPLTAYRRWFDRSTQLRANSWMLMTGSLGMLAATLPVQWLLPIWGWRSLYALLAFSFLVAMTLIAWQVPRCPGPDSADSKSSLTTDSKHIGYTAIWRSAHFWRVVPVGFVCHGSMVAMLTLWSAQWMTQVSGFSTEEAALGLFVIHLAVLISFWLWGMVAPKLADHRIGAEQLISWCLPAASLSLIGLVWTASNHGWGALTGLVFFCVVSSVVTLIQPALGLRFPSALAGRALSAYNLVVLLGIFVVQWGIGLLVDAAQAFGLSRVMSYQLTWFALAIANFLAWLHFVTHRSVITTES
jgi:predicted MFS family arabinose efflux permease